MQSLISQNILQIEKAIQELHNEALQIQQLEQKTNTDFAEKKRRIEANYNQTIQQLQSQKKSIDSAYQQAVAEHNTRKRSAQNETQKIQNQKVAAIQSKYTLGFQYAREQISWINSCLLDLSEKGEKTVISTEKPDIDAIKKLYDKIKDRSFMAFLKRIFKIGGYYKKKKMQHDFVLQASKAKYFYEEWLKKAQAAYQSELQQISPNLQAHQAQILNSIATSEQAAGVKKSDSLKRIEDLKVQAQRKHQQELSELEKFEADSKLALQNAVDTLRKKRDTFLHSSAVVGFSSVIKQSMIGSGVNSGDWKFDNISKEISNFSLGSIQQPIKSNSKSLPKELEKTMPEFFKNNNFLIPMLFPTNASQKFFYQYGTTSKPLVSEQIQYYILQKLRCAPLDSYHIYFIDPNDRGRNLGLLTATDEQNAEIGMYMRNTRDGIVATLKKIVTMIDQTPGLLEGEQSVYHFNSRNKRRRIKETILVLNDIQDCLSQDLLYDFKTIWENATRCGISILMTSTGSFENLRSRFPNANIDLSFLNVRDVYNISCVSSNTTLSFNGKQCNYRLCSIGSDQRTFLKKYRNPFEEENAGNIVNAIPVNDFRRIFKELFKKSSTSLLNGKIQEKYELCTDQLFAYAQDSTNGINLPVCIQSPLKPPLVADAFQFGTSTSIHSLVTGTAGSGKSTFLHMIIMSIILNYHPDDVELWLLDYGKVEFETYLANRPPHVRLISLEKTEDFTYSFLEYLQKKISEREKLFLSAGVTDLAAYRVKYGKLSMPRIVLIVDEFHVMTQHVKYSSEHRAILENALTEGRKFGLSCLFSNQTLSGLDGLTETARSQIGNRIAMKGNAVTDVKDTLAIPSNYYTDDLNNKMMQMQGNGDFLYRNAVFSVNAYKAIYISKDIRSEILNAIIKKNIIVKEDPTVYVINGTERTLLPQMAIRQRIQQKPSTSLEMYLGVPTTIEKTFSIVLEQKYNNNVLIAGRDSNMASDIIHSMMFSLLQNPKIRIIVLADETDEKYRMFVNFQDKIDPQRRIEVYDKYDGVCETINSYYSKISRKEHLDTPTAFFWFGLKDMFDEFSVCAPKQNGVNTATNYSSGGSFDFSQMLDSLSSLDGQGQSNVYSQTKIEPSREKDLKQYNAINDVLELLKLGSRYGQYNFIPLEFSGDIRYCRGLQLSQFTHKIALCMSKDESSEWGLRSMASELTKDLTALYTDGIIKKTFKPYKTNN